MTGQAQGVSAGTFAQVSALRARGPGRFQGGVHPEWTLAGRPNGGYLLAMLARAATSVSGHRDVIAASAHYLHSPDPGPVLIQTELLRAGRAASRVRARMSQRGQACVEALLTVGELDPTKTAYWESGVPQAGVVGYEECAPLVARTPDGRRVPIMEQIQVRLEPASAGFTTGRPSGRGELRGWLALPGGEAFDPSSLLFAVDAFPPATFDIEYTGWVPTLELTAYVRAHPVPGPVRVMQRAHLIDADRVDQSCHIWDGTGRLVAHGTQLAGIRLGQLAASGRLIRDEPGGGSRQHP